MGRFWVLTDDELVGDNLRAARILTEEVENMEDWTTVITKRRITKEHDPPRRISSETIQALIRRRMELRVSQEKADQICGFTKHTFRDIESHRLFPTATQNLTIQRHFGVSLQIT